MAAGATVCRVSPMDTSQEIADVQFGGASAMHERLVAYVHALQNQGTRRGVWGEHSYARGPGEPPRSPRAPRPPRRARTLLAPRAPSPPPALLDVDGPPSAPPSPPRRARPPEPLESDEEDPADAEDWEARVQALAPSPAHARLAAAVCRALRRMRLERLVSGGGERARGEARAAAAAIRRALAPLWLQGGGGGGGGAGGARAAPAWLQAALTACMPRGPRRLYEEALGALRAAAPRLAERLTGSWVAAERSAARALGPPLPAEGAGPWLVWVSGGRGAQDARWERRLAALMHTRVLRAPPGEGAAPPEPWCAAAAGAVRCQLTDALAEAGDRSVILGGAGAGAALCAVLARGAGGAGRAAGGVRGAVLVAPPLRTAEGARGARDEALRAVRLPLLLVVGERAPSAPHALANDVCEPAGLGAGARRLLTVAGADEWLRLPRRLRLRRRLSQDALDAALAEECVRWALETAEGEEAPPSPPPLPSPPTPTFPAPTLSAPAPPSRRHPLPTIVHQIDLDGPDDDYAHLPVPPSAPPGPPGPACITPTQSARSIEIVEGRVVSRAAGGTPLPLLPPLPPLPPPGRARARGGPSPADIMQMPIVFADDNATACSGTDSSSAGSPVTVTSGKARVGGATMTRVILAKRGGVLAVRGAGGPAPGAGGPAPGAGGPAAGGPAPGAPRRRLLVRRGMRVVASQDKPHN